MNGSKIDPSLAEVRRWREKAQRDTSHLDANSAKEEIHRRSKEFMRAHGLELKVERRHLVKI